MFDSVFNQFRSPLRGYHLLKGEKDTTTTPYPMRKKRSTCCCLLVGFIASVCLLATLLAILFTPHRFAADEILVHALMKHLKIPKTTQIFQLEKQYTLEQNEELREAAWAALYPPGGGFVTGFDPPLDQLEELNDLNIIPDQWCISMFHQLHCLESLSKAALMSHTGENNTAGAHNDPAHLAHCVSYLMQAIKCAGDTSLEKGRVRTREEDGVPVSEVSGWFTPHQCKSYDTIFDFTSRYSIALTERDYTKEG